jgi:TRAP-type C4-dicarboxylate transport system substrate-binding protein
LLLAAAQDSVAYMRELWDRMENESREFVIKAGVQVNEVDRAAFHAAARPVVERCIETSGLHEVYDAIRAVA